MDYSNTTHACGIDARDLPYASDSNKWNESQTAGAISWTWCKFMASSLERRWSSRISGADLSLLCPTIHKLNPSIDDICATHRDSLKAHWTSNEYSMRM